MRVWRSKPPQLGAGRAGERWTAAFLELGDKQSEPVESMNLRAAPRAGSNAAPGEEALQNPQKHLQLQQATSAWGRRWRHGDGSVAGHWPDTWPFCRRFSRVERLACCDSQKLEELELETRPRIATRSRAARAAHVRSACPFAESSHLGVISQSITFDTMRSSRVEATQCCHVSLSHAPAREGPRTRVLADVLTAVFTYPQNMFVFFV